MPSARSMGLIAISSTPTTTTNSHLCSGWSTTVPATGWRLSFGTSKMLRKVARPSSRALSIQKAKSINLGMVTMRIATEASPLSLCAVTLCYSTRWCLTADSTRGRYMVVANHEARVPKSGARTNGSGTTLNGVVTSPVCPNARELSHGLAHRQHVSTKVKTAHTGHRRESAKKTRSTCQIHAGPAANFANTPTQVLLVRAQWSIAV
mmetsp:Transcript_4257/g.13728  ORF Transcript_4257/g.13728 Transcript_4257/m.13728 type:complete len:207 (+) Transcript_4257:1137-1757(+)